MIDFHSHFLPEIDDGSDSVETSLAMLRESYRQGVRLIFATPHFYADEDNPEDFLRNRNEAFARVKEAIAEDGGSFPDMMLGAEILYFPGMSVADELYDLRMGGAPLLLIEPPMLPWSESMLNEIEQTGRNLRCIPVIAHVDRYMRILRDNRLLDRALDRRFLIQVNSSFFTRSSTATAALKYLREGAIHFIGSDCHDMEYRPPDLGEAEEAIALGGETAALEALFDRIDSFYREHT